MFGPLGLPAVPLAVIAAGLPFAAAGTVGAIKESRELFKRDYPEAKARVNTQRRHVMVVAHREEQSGRHADNPGARYEAAKLDRLQTERRAVKLERNLSPLAAGGMAVLTGGLAVAGAGVLTETIAGGGSIAASALGTTASALFLPSQVMLGVAATGDAVAGLRRDRQLKQDQASVAAVADRLGPDISASMREHTSRLRTYNAIRAGASATTAVGQGFMAAGSVATLTGVGSPVGAGLSGAGAALSIGALGARIAVDKRHDRYVGTGASTPAREAVGQRDIASLVEHDGLDPAIARVAANYDADRHAIAEAKLLSLITHSMTRELRSGQARDAHARHADIEKMAATGKKGVFTGTTLLKSDLRVMQQVLHSTAFPIEFFQGSATEVLDNVNQRLTLHPLVAQVDDQRSMKERVMRKSAQELLKTGSAEVKQALRPDAGEASRQLDEAAWARLRHDQPEVQQADSAHRARELSRQMKQDAKHLRHAMAKAAADLGHATQARQASWEPSPATPSTTNSIISTSRSNSVDSTDGHYWT